MKYGSKFASKYIVFRPFIALGAAAAFATACGGSGGSSGSLTTYGTGGAMSGGGSNNGGASNVASFAMTRTDLVSDQSGVAKVQDKNLVNAWGIAVNPAGPIWVSDNGTGLATVYGPDGTIAPLVVTIPVPSGAQGPSAPTGQAFNSTSGFMGDKFIIVTEDGTVTGWQSGNGAALRVDNSGSGAIYKGVAIVGKGNSATLWASNFNAGTIDVWDNNYTAISTNNGYTDPDLPSGYAPFNIAAIDDRVYVSYAKQDAEKEDDVKGTGNGFVSVFKTDGTFDKRLISKGALDAPWGMAKAPDSLGSVAGALFVGNFGDGKIHAYDIESGSPMARIVDSKGKEITIDGLWGLVFIPSADSDAGGTSALYFTAGPNDEKNGLFGKLEMK